MERSIFQSLSFSKWLVISSHPCVLAVLKIKYRERSPVTAPGGCSSRALVERGGMGGVAEGITHSSFSWKGFGTYFMAFPCSRPIDNHFWAPLPYVLSFKTDQQLQVVGSCGSGAPEPQWQTWGCWAEEEGGLSLWRSSFWALMGQFNFWGQMPHLLWRAPLFCVRFFPLSRLQLVKFGIFLLCCCFW